VGVQLVRRTTRRVEPTEVGLRLYAHGRSIQNEMQAARETITTLGQCLQGCVGVSVPSGYGQIVMSDWLIEFKRQYPALIARELGSVRYLACASRAFAQQHGLPTGLEQLRTTPLITSGAW
jgi:DNA-binding transcriptional LysR family regulator